MKKTLEAVDEENSKTMLNFIDMFLGEYRKMVAYECSRKTRAQLKDFFRECNSTMQECAIKFLMEQESIDYILVGMRKPTYIHQILLLKK